MRALIAILAITLLLPITASAQSLGNTDTFTISVNPQYPTPFSKASLSFLSSTIDLTNAVVLVSVGGKQIYQGSVRPVAITLGKAGSMVSVTVIVSSAGKQYAKSVTIQPQDVALIAEPVASAPALYKGKPLIPLEGAVRVVAMANVQSANGEPINPASLSYAWTVEGTRIANSSGIGKSSILVASPLQYRAIDVSVDVQSQEGDLVGGDSITLIDAEPVVRIYTNDPLLGILFDHALTSPYAIRGSEERLFAAPFSLPLTKGVPLLQWFLNGTAAQTGNSLTLRPAGSGEGGAELSLTASAGATEATAALSLTFGAKPSSNFFGL
ncbi:MAG: hypothetical protein WAW90_02065 [Minisyncoccia bacterium]